jgi:hypothetical protein
MSIFVGLKWLPVTSSAETWRCSYFLRDGAELLTDAQIWQTHGNSEEISVPWYFRRMRVQRGEAWPNTTWNLVVIMDILSFPGGNGAEWATTQVIYERTVCISLYEKNVIFCHVMSLRCPSVISLSDISSQIDTCVIPSDGSFRDDLPSNFKTSNSTEWPNFCGHFLGKRSQKKSVHRVTLVTICRYCCWPIRSVYSRARVAVADPSVRNSEDTPEATVASPGLKSTFSSHFLVMFKNGFIASWVYHTDAVLWVRRVQIDWCASSNTIVRYAGTSMYAIVVDSTCE